MAGVQLIFFFRLWSESDSVYFECYKSLEVDFYNMIKVVITTLLFTVSLLFDLVIIIRSCTITIFLPLLKLE